MKNLNKLILILICFLSLSVSAQVDDDPSKYFDDDGISERKNFIFTDLSISYINRPYYTLGYMYKFKNNFVVSGGILMTKSNYVYNYNMLMSGLYDPSIALKANTTNFHYFLEISYKNEIFRNSWNRSGFGMEYYQFDLSTIQHYYMNQTLFSKIFMDNHIIIAIDIQFGVRVFHLNNLYYSRYPTSVFLEPINPKQFGFYMNAPLKIGFHF